MSIENPAILLSTEEQEVTREAGAQIALWYFATPEKYRDLVIGDISYLADVALMNSGLEKPSEKYDAARQLVEFDATWKIDLHNTVKEMSQEI